MRAKESEDSVRAVAVVEENTWLTPRNSLLSTKRLTVSSKRKRNF